MPPAAMDEDLVAQSNAWLDVEAFNGRSWQQDALDYTRAFRGKFPAWARAYEQQAQSDTNRPPFTAEDQAKISALATELEKLQLECVEKSLPPGQEKSLEIINQIRELLPKDPNGGQSQQQNQNQDQQQNQSQQNQDQNQQNQNQDQQQDQQDQQQDEDNQQQDDSEGGEEENPEEQEVDAVLKKAQERSDEHEAEKKARMRKAPLPPNERDW
jgi:Ca-activated chloride channel family protein